MKLRVLIADDEPLARKRLRRFLEEDGRVEIVEECSAGPETLDAIQAKKPDVIFLDVRMPELNGFDVLKRLDPAHQPVVVLVTGHDQFALQGFDINAADYLLKPFDRERFQAALQRARDRLRHPSTSARSHGPSEVSSLLPSTPKHLERICIVSTSDILWIRAADNYAELHMGKTVHLLRNTISALAQELPKDRFARISRSLLVNLDRVKEIRSKSHGDFAVFLNEGTCLSGSRTYRRSLEQLLGKSQC
jgi:two-component system, LytTR family, response regulator